MRITCVITPGWCGKMEEGALGSGMACSAELEAVEGAPPVSGLLRSVEQADGIRFLVPLPAMSSRALRVLECDCNTRQPGGCTLSSSTEKHPQNGTRDNTEGKCSSSESRGSSAEEQLNECSHSREKNKPYIPTWNISIVYCQGEKQAAKQYI